MISCDGKVLRGFIAPSANNSNWSGNFLFFFHTSLGVFNSLRIDANTFTTHKPRFRFRLGSLGMLWEPFPFRCPIECGTLYPICTNKFQLFHQYVLIFWPSKNFDFTCFLSCFCVCSHISQRSGCFTIYFDIVLHFFEYEFAKFRLTFQNIALFQKS